MPGGWSAWTREGSLRVLSLYEFRSIQQPLDSGGEQVSGICSVCTVCMNSRRMEVKRDLSLRNELDPTVLSIKIELSSLLKG